MKKNKKGLITAVILLILLLIVYIVIRNLHLDEEEEEDSTETVYEIDAADSRKRRDTKHYRNFHNQRFD